MKDEDFLLLGVLIYHRQTDGQTNEWTFAIVESLSRLKRTIQSVGKFKKSQFGRDVVPTSGHHPLSKVGNKVVRTFFGLQTSYLPPRTRKLLKFFKFFFLFFFGKKDQAK